VRHKLHPWFVHHGSGVTEANRYGLTRTIPRDVRRAVRQRCGFACVCCEAGIFQYHHFKPPFADAVRHDAEGITLLCGTCHQSVTGGLWSDDKIEERDRARRGKPVTGNVLMDVREPIVVALGSIVMLGAGPLLVVDGEPLLSIASHPTRGMLLSGRLYDEAGDVALAIDSNTLQTRSHTWDVELVGQLMTVRSGPGRITAQLRMHPPHSVHIERLAFTHKGWKVDVDAAHARVWIGGVDPSTKAKVDLVNTVVWIGGALSLDGGTLSMSGGAALVKVLNLSPR
jgi:hypothetical protein